MPYFSKKILIGSSQKNYPPAIQHLLELKQFEFFFAQSGEEVKRMVRLLRPQIVVLSYDLSDISGPECCQSLKTAFTEGDFSIVIQVEKISPALEEPCYSCHCDGLVSDEMNKEEISWHIQHLFEETSHTNFTPCELECLVLGNREKESAQIIQISSQSAWVHSRVQFSTRFNYRLQIRMGEDKIPLFFWVKPKAIREISGQTQTLFQFLSLTEKDRIALSGLDATVNSSKKIGPLSSEKPAVTNTQQKENGLRLILFFSLFLVSALLFWQSFPQSPSVLPPETPLRLQTPLPMEKARAVNSHLFIYLTSPWDKLEEEKKRELIASVLVEMKTLGYRDLQLVGKNGTVKGSARVGGAIRLP